MTTTPTRRVGAIQKRRLILAGLLLLVYAVPLFFPPSPVPLGPVSAADAGLLERIVPGVPPIWVAIRLAALALASILLSGAPVFAEQHPLGVISSGAKRSEYRNLRALALAVAVLHAVSAAWASALGASGQTAYLLMLLVPALLLGWPQSFAAHMRPRAWRRGLAAAALILLWMGARLLTDLNSPRVADVVDGWLGFTDIVRFIHGTKNLLTDPFDPNLPGVGGVLLFFQGMPLFQLGVASISFRLVQVLQILWLAASAAGVGVLARKLVGPGVSLVAIAVFLFAPYTRFVTLFPSPFLVGPIYATAIALCAVAACRQRSEAALAALGALSGLAITYPGVVPTVALLVLLTVWHLRAQWRPLWVGFAAGLASFVAVVAPALSNVLNPSQMARHLRWDGVAALIDAFLLGQLPVRTYSPLRPEIFSRPLDIVVAAVIAPFAHPRLSIRLWGDALFDPIGGALIGIGLAACVRAYVSSASARLLLLFFGAALCPAFVSPVDIVDIVHAVAFPVPAALLAAAGFAVIQRHLGSKPRLLAAAVTAAAIAIGGTVLFDVVNPRILSASSFGIMFRTLPLDAAQRVVVLTYPRTFVPNTSDLNTGWITAFAGRRPVGYLEYDGGELPVSGFAEEGKDLLFWSHGFNQDFKMTDAICRHWPSATFYEIWDEAGLGRVHAARLGGLAWEPEGPASRWRTSDCQSRDAASPAIGH